MTVIDERLEGAAQPRWVIPLDCRFVRPAAVGGWGWQVCHGGVYRRVFGVPVNHGGQVEMRLLTVDGAGVEHVCYPAGERVWASAPDTLHMVAEALLLEAAGEGVDGLPFLACIGCGSEKDGLQVVGTRFYCPRCLANLLGEHLHDGVAECSDEH